MSVTLLKLFSANERSFNMNMQGITHEESLKQINNSNCINWIAGHIVFYRNSVLGLLGLPPIAGEQYKPIYERGSKMTNTTKAEKVETLSMIFNAAQPGIMEGISKITDEQVLGKIAFAGFHEAYHIGQLGIVRKLIGKEGAIK